ncbi:hypothetical protein K502DRAFT_52465 [Neoconidiobolus thromboides FSU 785]|nr:hypothetical protein K502DRAFT_52465 [Neoconidiobolus thromboides FSU 785]
MYRKGAFFPLIFTITEITVIPTNLVWVLQRIEMKDSPLYSYGLFFRAIFFLVFRSFITPFLFYYALNNPGDISPYSTLLANYDASLPSNIILNSLNWEEKYFILRSNLSKIPFIITALSSFFIFVLGLLNTVWSVVIVNNYLMRVLRKPKRKLTIKDTITNNANLKFE